MAIKYDEIIKDEAFVGSLTELDSMDAFTNAFKEKGVEFVEPVQELSEEDLAVVVGGMSSLKAAQVVAVTYYEICRYGKFKTYSAKDINEAVRITDGSMKVLNAASWKALKWGLKQLGL